MAELTYPKPQFKPYKEWHYILTIDDMIAHMFWVGEIIYSMCGESSSLVFVYPTSPNVGFDDLKEATLCIKCYAEMGKVNNFESVNPN